MVQNLPLAGQELDSAVEGVQKYLESSGFPKMTRGEVLDFLNDFSRSSRVSRSDNVKKFESLVTPLPSSVTSKTLVSNFNEDKTVNTYSKPKIPNGESPLSYGYPLSINKQTQQLPTVPTPMIFVTVQNEKLTNDKKPENMLKVLEEKNAQKKNIGPSVDLSAYTMFKKIPEAKNLRVDNEMKNFLNNFGLLDVPKTNKSINSKESQRRIDDVGVTEIMDDKLLESVLVETGNNNINVSQLKPFLEKTSTRDHVFNPLDSNVKTVDVNKIAKIVENIRLLSDDNNTLSLSPDLIQKKLENITAAIATIDQPSDNKVFNGYEVFFDDNSKEVDSDLPEMPADSGTEPLNKVNNPPDPLSVDELQQLVEKNKIDVKRQEPMNETTASTLMPTEKTVITSTLSNVEITSKTTDSSTEATSLEVTSDASVARDLSTTPVADNNPSLSQLAESFGGGETASNPPPIPSVDESETPKSDRPRNGLYFYVDWNSFLTVNEGQKNQVNLRFSPKAGNPAHFLKVNVP